MEKKECSVSSNAGVHQVYLGSRSKRNFTNPVIRAGIFLIRIERKQIEDLGLWFRNQIIIVTLVTDISDFHKEDGVDGSLILSNVVNMIVFVLVSSCMKSFVFSKLMGHKL